MRMFFYIGVCLLGLAFVAAATETVSHAVPGGARGFIIPAYDLWYTMWPASLLIAEIRIERIAPWLWDPVVLTLLQLPGWAVLGIPGGFIAWFTRPNRGSVHQDEINEVLSSFDLYDDLTREAQKTNDPNEEHGPQDIQPDITAADDGEHVIEDGGYNDPYKLPPRKSD